MKIKNKAVEKISYNLRAKQGAVMIPAQEFGTKTASIFKKQYSLGLVADQNRASPVLLTGCIFLVSRLLL
jgi:hypothetical protein